MGATNTTTYYNLSQFVGTDKPAWLQDYNGDMLKIDTGINAAKVAADSAALDASAAQLDATTALGDITNTINPAITSLQTTVGNQGGAINTINSLIGNGTPTTTDQTIIGAINEINAEVGAIDSALTNMKYTTMAITTGTKYSDIASLVMASISAGKTPHILADITHSGTTFTKVLCDYEQYISGTYMAFSKVVGSVYMAIEVGASSTSGHSGDTFSNATLYY